MRLFIGFIFILIFAFGCGKKAQPHKPGDTQNGEPVTTVAPPTTPPVVKEDSPRVVLKDWELPRFHDSLRKDMSPFMGKQILVIGYVANVDREHNIVTLGNGMLRNGSYVNSKVFVLCFFGSATADMADCKVGQSSVIKGIYSGTNASGLGQILKCELVTSESKKIPK